MSGGTDTAFLVRHIPTGLYVGGYTLSSAGVVHTVELQLAGRPGALAFGRDSAEKVANAWIALTGDHGIEIEPVEDALRQGGDADELFTACGGR